MKIRTPGTILPDLGGRASGQLIKIWFGPRQLLKPIQSIFPLDIEGELCWTSKSPRKEFPLTFLQLVFHSQSWEVLTTN